jgi:polyisoprenoid-binding protein YceI
MSQTKWVLDPAHSELQFKVKHMMITNVSGSFSDFTASLDQEGDSFANASIRFSAKVDSISTGNEQRDGHLKSPEFFDTASHPEITFESTSFTLVEGDDWKLNGTLTIKGVSHNVSLDVEFGGIQNDPWGNTKSGFSLKGKINRKDFGLNWNAVLETGGVMVSEEVRIHAEIQLLRQG